ncbi:MAG TPA: hypothetical protein VFF03_19665 [Rhodocyclaceae bacterium]|nr:hypothetical protein [Rhodocyclaceae bacterium]
MKKILLAPLLAHAIAASAATSTRLETPVTYHPNAGVVESVRSECQLEDMLATRVGNALRRINSGGNGTIEAGTDPADSQVIRLQITHVLGIGGGAWTGPKAITVSAELLENGKVLRQTKINRWTTGGVFGAFKGTCSILERSADAIGKDLVRWARNPSYKIVDEPPPKEASASGENTPPANENITQASAAAENKPEAGE